MRIFFIILIILFNIQSWAKADDIRDFEIEGMSLGDSALNYFNQKELTNKDDVYYYKSKTNKLIKFQTKSYRNYEKPKKFRIYENIELHFKKNDPQYIIKSIGGVLYFRNDINGCLKKKIRLFLKFQTHFKVLRKVRLIWNLG